MSNIPEHARVIIIGGGVIGCSVAYHLTKLGWKKGDKFICLLVRDDEYLKKYFEGKNISSQYHDSEEQLERRKSPFLKIHFRKFKIHL